jgi:DNA-directed RNA polymerase specialized sigma24 family protein
MEDVEQETFLKAWRGLGVFRGEAARGTWLTRLALDAGREGSSALRCGNE